jgi:hypothetical protein
VKTFIDPVQALCWATEVELATIEGLKSVKRTPKCELRRHQEISDSLLKACEMFACVVDAERVRCSRVARHLASVRHTYTTQATSEDKVGSDDA